MVLYVKSFMLAIDRTQTGVFDYRFRRWQMIPRLCFLVS